MSMTTIAQATLPLSSLTLSALNVRPMNTDDDITGLKASLLTQGVIQPLVVRVADRNDSGLNEVTAGGRRLRALMELAEEGAIEDDYAVKVTGEDGDDSDTLARSLAENMIRKQMSPVEEFEAFARLADEGRSEEQIAREYGCDVRHVKGRLRLGRLAEPIRAALKAGTITLDTAKVFTTCTDVARQRAVFESFDNPRWANQHEVRALLMDGRVRSTDTLAELVGREAYEARGGAVTEDLFGQEVYFDDADLVTEIALEMLQEKAEALRAEGGWAWAMAALEYDDDVRGLGYLKGEPAEPTAEEVAELERIEARMDSIDDSTEPSEGFDTINDEWDALDARHDELSEGKRTYSDEAKEHAGVLVVNMGHRGVEVRVGAVRPEDIEAMRAANADGEGDDDQPVSGGAEVTSIHGGAYQPPQANAAPEDKKKASLSNPVCEDLSIFRGVAVAEAMVRKPDIAHKYLVFVLASEIIGDRAITTRSDSGLASDYCHGTIGGLGLTATVPTQTKTAQAVYDDLPGAQVLAAAKADLDIDWMTKGTTEERLAAFLKLPAKAVKAIEAYCVASLVRSVPFDLPEAANRVHGKDTAIKAAARAAGADLRRSFTPTGANLLGRLTKPRLLEIVTEILGEGGAAGFTGHAKAALVTDVEKLFNGTAELDPDQKARADAWMPAAMDFEPTDRPKAMAADDGAAGEPDEGEANEDGEEPDAIAA